VICTRCLTVDLRLGLGCSNAPTGATRSLNTAFSTRRLALALEDVIRRATPGRACVTYDDLASATTA
jgi:hypothetical protein